MQLRSQYKALPLFDEPYATSVDQKRLGDLAQLVYDLMSDGEWRTFSEIKLAVNKGSENGIAATLRRFRKLSGHAVNKRRRGFSELGIWEYSLKTNA